MSLDPEVAAFLTEYNATAVPSMRDVPVSESRAAVGPVPGPPEPVGRVEDLSIRGPAGELRVRVYEPSQPGRGTSVFFHGGGWVLGDLETHDALCRRVCNTSGHRVVAVDYRRAPEHRYPAALDDAYAATNWVARRFPGPLAVWGDSAGGNLAAAVALLACDRRGPTIHAQALIYPITDCNFDRESYRRHAEGYFLTTDTMRWFWELYVPDPHDRRQPYASPLQAQSLAELPPALVLTAEFDVLLDEGRDYAARLHDAGVPVEIVASPGMIHGYLRRLHAFRRAREACETVGRFLHQRLSYEGTIT